MKKTVMIVGAGPAGLMAAEKLASAGIEVSFFDHRVPWNKPCGGLISEGVVAEFPFFSEYPYSILEITKFLVESPTEELRVKKSGRSCHLISRLELGKFLLQRAIAVGATHIPQRVIKIRQTNGKVELKTAENNYTADIVVGADGANSRVRKYLCEKIPEQQIALTCGYYLKGFTGKESILKFLDLEGYIWVFSGPTHTCAGISGRRGTITTRELFEKLDVYLESRTKGVEKSMKWSALIPSINDPDFFTRPCSGENWVLIGDAAGHVNPSSGEGIVYALRSGQMAAEAIIANDLSQYDSLWQYGYGDHLKRLAGNMKKMGRIAETYGPSFMGSFLNNTVGE